MDYFKVARQLLDAIKHLHDQIDCTHGLIGANAIVWSENNDLKLSHWPILTLTDFGFSLGTKTIFTQDVSYIAPEQVKDLAKKPRRTCDIWSAGMTLLKLIKPSCRLHENPCRVAFCDDSQQVIDQIDGNLDDDLIPMSDIWTEFFQACLHPDPMKRASLNELISILDSGGLSHITSELCLSRDHFDLNEWEYNATNSLTMNISEIYYLWRLSIGRNFESEQRQDDYPPIFKIPYLIVSEKQNNHESEPRLSDHIIIDTNPKIIPLEKFKNDINQLNSRIFYPLILTDIDSMFRAVTPQTMTPEITTVNNDSNPGSRKSSKTFMFADLDTISIKSSIQSQIQESSKTLPLVIKEANFAYQCERMMLFKRLIGGYPYLRDQLIREASIDIPPYYRAKVWATLLEVNVLKSEMLYKSIDKTAPSSTERQINVDIPRCHQYNDLMASPQGHQKLARILKAWLNHNSEDYVYWQGLDSLVAPFLLLNFDNEAIAFACFNAFVNKYLRGMFCKENQLIVQQYLSMFSELLSYHDPSLAGHLDRLGFLPNLYAIPWFLTMFTHVLPLHKILHVWDCLMLGDEKYPLCIGLAILNQLREDLLGFNFNDCLGVFSDLPEIDIEKCIRDANHFYCTTPDKLINLYCT